MGSLPATISAKAQRQGVRSEEGTRVSSLSLITGAKVVLTRNCGQKRASASSGELGLEGLHNSQTVQGRRYRRRCTEVSAHPAAAERFSVPLSIGRK